MIVTKCTQKGILYSGSDELLAALPSGMIRKLEKAFDTPYPKIYNVLSGLRYSKDSKILECAVKLINVHEATQYEQKINDILNEYSTTKQTA